MNCTRSHPHDNPCPDHDLLTEVARLTNRLARSEARVVELEAGIKNEKHVSNEWADCTANALQWLRNISDGISTTDAALASVTDNIAHCREVASQTRTPPLVDLVQEQPMALKTRMCNMCQFWFEGEPFEIEPDDGVQRWIRKPSCIRGYNPRFYQPNSPRDEFWGWKRRCADYFENAMENPFSTSDTQ